MSKKIPVCVSLRLISHDLVLSSSMIDEPKSCTLLQARLVSYIKRRQRVSRQFRGAWRSYCTSYAGGIKDPMRHDVQSIAQFISVAADQNGASDLIRAVLIGDDEVEQPQHSLVALDQLLELMSDVHVPSRPKWLLHHTALVEQIKAGQRHCMGCAQLWWRWCARFGGGRKDPSGHTTQFLERFLTRYQVLYCLSTPNN